MKRAIKSATKNLTQSTLKNRTLLAVLIALSVSTSLPVAHADELLSGTASVRSKNTQTMLVQLGDQNFRVTDSSVIRDASGARVGLRALDVPDLGRGGKDLMLSPVVGRFTATRKGSQLFLNSLDIESNAK